MVKRPDAFGGLATLVEDWSVEIRNMEDARERIIRERHQDWLLNHLEGSLAQAKRDRQQIEKLIEDIRAGRK